MYNAKYAEDFYWTIHLIQDLYKNHAETDSRDLAEYFNKFSQFTELLLKVMIIVFLTCTAAFPSYSFYMYFVKGELMPIMPLYLPGLDETTIIGFILLNLYHFICATISAVGLSALEFLTAIIIISSLIFSKLISRDLQQINDDLEDGDSGILIIKERLRNIFLMHQELSE